MTQTNHTAKLAKTAGSLSALALLPVGAQAGVIQVTGSPVSLSMAAADGSIAHWDVDGSGGSDFRLWKQGAAGVGTIFLGSDGSNGRGLIAPFATDNVQGLNTSFMVGPSLAGYAWGSGAAGGYAARNAMQTGPGAFKIGYDWNFNIHTGDNFFGFRFMNGANEFYGVGVINFDIVNGIVTLEKWAYNDTPDGQVHVENITGSTVPEPSTLSLALIGMGAGGVRAWRRRRQAQALAA